MGRLEGKYEIMLNENLPEHAALYPRRLLSIVTTVRNLS
jgi:hypothetical protein